MRLFELISPSYTVWENGSPTDQTKKDYAYINPNMIASITYYKGTGVWKDWLCSKVIVNCGSTTKTYYDERLPVLLTEAINNFK